MLVGALPGTVPRYWFQRVCEAWRTKNRLHLDLRCQDLDVEVIRVVGFGGRVLVEHTSHVVLADPEDDEFCLLR